MGQHLGVGLAGELVALALEHGAQLVVVFDDAVVHHGHAAGTLRVRGVGVLPRAMAEVRVGVVHGRRAVGGPAGVGDAGRAFQLLLAHLRHQFGHA